MLTTNEIKKLLRSGRYAFPGGYPLYFIADDGEALSFQAVYDNWPSVCHSTLSETRDGWLLLGVQVNWGDQDLFCSHTGERIESAYADDIDENEEEEMERIDLPRSYRLEPNGVDYELFIGDRKDTLAVVAPCEVGRFIRKHFQHLTKGDLVEFLWGARARDIDTAIPLSAQQSGIDARLHVMDYRDRSAWGRLVNLKEVCLEMYPVFALHFFNETEGGN